MNVKIKQRIRRFWQSNWRRIALATLGLGAGIIAWTAWTLTGRYDEKIYPPEALARMPRRPVAIVFGAGYWPSGALSAVLQDRLDAAIELYEADRVEILLFSGDNSIVEYNEPQRMLEYALEQGIPREDIVLDYAGRRTYDTCYRAEAIFQVPEAILVTNRYHLPRALQSCNHLGVDAIGYVADRQRYPRRRFAWYCVREVAALWCAWFDLYVRQPLPILGEPLPIYSAD
ncbi:MAG: vancomycin high temperature exclusion protein [Anaerolineales bacterium]